MQALFQSAQHIYEKRQGSGSLLTTPFSLVLCKEYFDCSQRNITFKSGGRGESVLFYFVVLTVTSCIDTSVRIVTKSPKMEPLLIFSISLTASIPKVSIYRMFLSVFLAKIEISMRPNTDQAILPRPSASDVILRG